VHAIGTRYVASTDVTGNFSISNMRVGGPQGNCNFVDFQALLIVKFIFN
jgi:hypothetical protein